MNNYNATKTWWIEHGEKKPFCFSSAARRLAVHTHEQANQGERTELITKRMGVHRYFFADDKFPKRSIFFSKAA